MRLRRENVDIYATNEFVFYYTNLLYFWIPLYISVSKTNPESEPTIAQESPLWQRRPVTLQQKVTPSETVSSLEE